MPVVRGRATWGLSGGLGAPARSGGSTATCSGREWSPSSWTSARRWSTRWCLSSCLVLGINKSLIGLIEGIAETTASMLKMVAGWLSDKLGKRKPLMVFGYGISTLSRPLLALAGAGAWCSASRFIDRFGKGVRTAPRDAIVADSCDKKELGRSFGFHRAMDQFGGGARSRYRFPGAVAASRGIPHGVLDLPDPCSHLRRGDRLLHPRPETKSSGCGGGLRGARRGGDG